MLQAWAQRQPDLLGDPAFIPVLLEQLGKAALQLEEIGQWRGTPALQLELADLVAWGKACADARLAASQPAAPLTPPHN